MKRHSLFFGVLLFVSMTMYAAKTDVVVTNTAGATLSFSSTNSYEWEWYTSNQKLRSTNYHVASSTSQTTITITTETDCKFSFDYSVSSESNHDKLSVSIDGASIISNISGSTSNTCTVSLSRGTHTMLLKYVKDSSQDSGEDRAFVSNFNLSSTQIVYNTTSEITGETGVTEIICR